MLRSLVGTAGRTRGHCVVGGAGDGGNDVLRAGVADVEDTVVAPETQHEDAVGDRHDVGHVVADQDHPEPTLAQPFHEVKHLGGLGDAERRGGLVEHDDLGFAQ